MKYKIEKNTVQETLVIPLFARKVCSELYPNLYRDETAVSLINEIDYDFSEAEKNSRGLMQRFGSLEVAMREANNSSYGLTGGFFSEDKEEVQWYLDHIEAGVVYVNRAGGATTGAWPGYQTFGGWKGSGSTGKNGGGPYYVQQYMHEQSQTVVD